MSLALSVDLRVRVLAFVAAGASHRAAAERIGVSAASVSRWRSRQRASGDVGPGPLGGDRRSRRAEEQADLILSLLADTPDITIEEMRAALADEGQRFGYGTLHRFLARRGITRKKRRRTPPNKSVRTS